MTFERGRCSPTSAAQSESRDSQATVGEAPSLTASDVPKEEKNEKIMRDDRPAQLGLGATAFGNALSPSLDVPSSLRRLAQMIGPKELMYRYPDGDLCVVWTRGERRRLARLLNDVSEKCEK